MPLFIHELFKHCYLILYYFKYSCHNSVTASIHRAVPFYFCFNEEELENTSLMDCQAEILWHDVLFCFFSLLIWKDSLFARWQKEPPAFKSVFHVTIHMSKPSWPPGGAVAALLCAVQVFCLRELPFGFTTLTQEMNSRGCMRDCVCLIGLCGNFSTSVSLH